MDLPTLIILAIVCVAIGFILDNLLRLLRSTEKNKGAALGTNPIQLLRVWRDPNRTGIILEVGEKIAHAPAELDPEQLDQVNDAFNLLQKWLRQEAQRPTLISTPSQDDQLVSESLPPVLIQAEPEPESLPEAIKRPSLNPIQVVANALRAEIRKPPGIADQSLATQVDIVLQEKIIGTPFEKRGIHLLDAPDQGLLVQVGIEKYQGVDEVPEAEIREIIREAVAEWGRRTSPEKKGGI